MYCVSASATLTSVRKPSLQAAGRISRLAKMWTRWVPAIKLEANPESPATTPVAVISLPQWEANFRTGLQREVDGIETDLNLTCSVPRHQATSRAPIEPLDIWQWSHLIWILLRPNLTYPNFKILNWRKVEPVGFLPSRCKVLHNHLALVLAHLKKRSV